MRYQHQNKQKNTQNMYIAIPGADLRRSIRISQNCNNQFEMCMCAECEQRTRLATRIRAYYNTTAFGFRPHIAACARRVACLTMQGDKNIHTRASAAMPSRHTHTQTDITQTTTTPCADTQHRRECLLLKKSFCYTLPIN